MYVCYVGDIWCLVCWKVVNAGLSQLTCLRSSWLHTVKPCLSLGSFTNWLVFSIRKYMGFTTLELSPNFLLGKWSSLLVNNYVVFWHLYCTVCLIWFQGFYQFKEVRLCKCFFWAAGQKHKYYRSWNNKSWQHIYYDPVDFSNKYCL